MKTTYKEKNKGFIANIDTANEEIQRLSDKLSIKPKGFIPKIDKANEEIERLQALLAETNAKPTAKTDVVQRPTPKLNIAPKPTDPPTRKVPPGATGLQRAIYANILAQGGEVDSPKIKDDKLTGLQRAIAANIKQQAKSKS